MIRTSWALAVDFGTSRSAGAICSRGSVAPLEVEGNRWMASAVVLAPDGTVLVGAAAEAAAAVHPDRLERTPKHRLGSAAPLLLGGDPLEPADAVAAVLGVFLAEGRLRHGGADPGSVVLTHPVRWGDLRKGALAEAGRRAGLETLWLTEEPVAAAVHYTTEDVGVGDHVAVYDLGGGTFDTAVLRRTADGFEVVGTPGGDDTIGGEDFDHALFRMLGRQLAADDPDLWDRLCNSSERRWKTAALDLLAQARRAKEALSAYTSTQVFVAVADRDLVVNRSELEALILDDVERTVDMLEDTVAGAGLTADDLAATYLVGGSSRIPLIAQLLTERFGDRVTTRDEPKSVVALGAARIAGRGLEPGPTGGPAANTPTGRGAAAHEGSAAADPAAAAPVLEADLATEQPARLAWRLQLARAPGRIGTTHDAVVVSTQDGDMHAFDTATGTRRWAVHAGSWASAAPASDGAVVVAGFADGTVAALSAADGRVLWRVPTGGSVYSAPLLDGDSVVVGNDRGVVTALDRNTGAVRWSLPLGAAVRADPFCTGGRIILAAVDGQILCVDAASGLPAWGYRCAASVSANPAIWSGQLLVPCEDGLLYALDTGTGAPLWAYGTEGPLHTPVVCGESVVYAASGDGYVHAVDVTTGEGLWRYPCGGDSSGPAVAGTVLVVDTGQGDLRSIDVAGRRVRWRVSTGASNPSRPLILGGLVMVATTFAHLYALYI